MMDIACVKSVLHTTSVTAQDQGSDSSDTRDTRDTHLPSCVVYLTLPAL